MVATFRPVSKQSPCAVCGGDHKCSTTADGLLVCGRQSGPVPGFRHLGPCKDPQWHKYRSQETGIRKQGRRPGTLTPDSCLLTPDLAAQAREFEAHLTDRRRADLAARLGLPADCTHRLPGLGYSPAHGAWTIPERNPAGAVVGVGLRFPDGTKRMLTGSHRALALPGGWADGPGPVLVVEGASDVLAWCAVGLGAVGRPGAESGLEMLAGLLRTLPADKPVLVVGENDKKPDGKWPGRDGAVKAAEAVAKAVGRPVAWSLPPADYKDSRAWVSDRLAGLAEGGDAEAVGRDLVAELQRTQVAVNPPHLPRLVAPNRFPPLVEFDALPLPGADGANWVWDGFLARDAVTLLSALPKCGKTTLLTHLLAALTAGGEFCGRTLAAGRAVVISVEPAGVWAVRGLAVGGLPMVRGYTRGHFPKPTDSDWDEFTRWLEDLLAADPADLVVFDTLSNLWPVRDENSAAEVGTALAKLHRITAGRAVLLVHHLRKSDGQEGTGSRGSGALAGFVDIILELRRPKPDPTGRRRLLTGYGRYDRIPAEWVVELVEADGTVGYVHRPEKGPEERRSPLQQAIWDVLPTDGPGLTADEIMDRLPAAVKPSQRSALLRAIRIDGVKQVGEGKKGSPLYFWRREDSSSPTHHSGVGSGDDESEVSVGPVSSSPSPTRGEGDR